MRLANHSGHPFRGWIRTTTDRQIPAAGRVGDVRFVRGAKCGLDLWAVDVRVDLAQGETKTARLQDADPYEHRVDLPQDLLQHFGGPLRINGLDATVRTVQVNGAAIEAHATRRIGAFWVDVWLRWYPDEPGFVAGEVMVTHSSPLSFDLAASGWVALTWGDALVQVSDQAPGSFGTVFDGRLADGQAVALPVRFAWPRHIADWSTLQARAAWGVWGVGIEGALLASGHPLWRPHDVRAWAAVQSRAMFANLRGFESPAIGPAANSRQTGNQEDQAFVGGEAIEVPGAILPRYLAALGMARRPCHHLEHDGRLVDPGERPNWRCWDGRTHWHSGVSPDRLGKLGVLPEHEARGWWGPDVEHWCFATLAAAHRLTGSPALQKLLRHQAMVYLAQWTVQAGVSTSSVYAARAVGWEALGVCHLWRELTDRNLADRVVTRWRERWTALIRPAYIGKDILDVYRDDLRLGTGDWWMPWQQSLAAWGLDVAGRVLNEPLARAVALRAARTVVELAYRREGDRWVEYEVLAVDGRAKRDGDWRYRWLPCALAIVARAEPGNRKAQELWAEQLVAPSTWVCAPEGSL